MVKIVKSNLKKIYRVTVEWPIVGRLVRIGAAAFRLPEIKAACLTLIERQPVPESGQFPAISQSLSDLSHRQLVFESEQLPSLLQTLSDLNQRQLSSDNDRDNLVKSVPVALRKSTRELAEIRGQIESLTNTMHERMHGVPGQLEDITNLMQQRLDEMQVQVRGMAVVTDEMRRQLESVRALAEQRVGEARSQVEHVVGSMEVLRGQIESVTGLLESRNGEVRGQVEDIAKSANETRGQLENVMGLMQQRIEEVRGQVEDAVRSMNETRNQLENGTIMLEQRIGDARGHVQGVMGAMDETRAQVENAMNSVRYLLGRVEFVRRELMFEMRYGGLPANGGERIKTRTEILSPEKLNAAREVRLRLNLGCGHIPLDGYLNVDRRGLPGVDIVAEVDDLPFVAEEVDEIFSSHLLEHFPAEQLRRELLPYLVGLLKHGGEFHAVVPDAQAMIQNYANGSYPFADLREVTFGSQDYDGDFHYNMFTPQSLSDALQAAGLKNVRVIEAGRRNGACYEFEIAADK